MTAGICAHLPRIGRFWLGGSPRSGSRQPRPACRRAASQPLTLCFANATSGHNPDTNERILRYPDGNVRRIRYPAPQAEDAEAGEPGGDSWEAVSVWKAPAKARKPADQPPKQQQPPATAAAAPQPAAPAPPEQLPQERPDVLPDSPLQLLRYFTSDAYQQEQRELERKVRESYQVLEGCPWVAPRPLYVLATSQPGREEALTYTLRTLRPRPELEDALGRVLGRERRGGGPLISCGEVVDGVVAFEEEGEAERYGALLEAEGRPEVSVARCDSHALFRSVQDARGVVVLLRPAPQPDGSSFLPQPHQLATALRGKRSMEDDRSV